jgi:hypothetical protein
LLLKNKSALAAYLNKKNRPFMTSISHVTDFVPTLSAEYNHVIDMPQTSCHSQLQHKRKQRNRTRRKKVLFDTDVLIHHASILIRVAHETTVTKAFQICTAWLPFHATWAALNTHCLSACTAKNISKFEEK